MASPTVDRFPMTVLNDNLTALKELTERLANPKNSGTFHEELLSSQNEMFRLVLDAISEGVIVADTNEKFLIFNRAAEEIFGIGPTHSKLKEWPKKYKLYKPDKKTLYEPEDACLARAIRGLETDNLIYFIKDQNGDGIWVSTNGRPLRDRLGTLIGGVIVIRRITDLR